MEEELEKFLLDQKEKLAHDKASLLREPPYMEIRGRGEGGDEHVQKENNTLPHRTTHNKECVGLSLPLGEEYERKKHKLQQELRQDYRRYMMQKQKQCGGDKVATDRLPPKMKDVATLTDPIPQPCVYHLEAESDGSSEVELKLKPRRRRQHRTQVAKHSELLQPPANQEEGAGLLPGGSDACSAQHRRKEHYRQELPEQITERQRIGREKELRTGRASEKQLQNLRRSRHGDYDVNLHDNMEEEGEWAPPQEPRLAFESPHLGHRVQYVPPALPSMQHRSIYDDAYVYYSSRHPLNGPVSPLPTEGFGPPSQEHREAHYGASGVGDFPSVKSKDTDISYREALRQQIEERALCRRVAHEQRREQEAREQVEFRTLQPWGRGGGGAPLRDSTGNLITDLNQMHRLNEEAYMNGSRTQGPAGIARSHTPQFASLFNDPPASRHQLEQDKYKAYLKQQIEEKRRRRAEEREREREQEEREEKRLAEQRERIQREYQEEQDKRRRKELEQRLKNEELMALAEERRKEAERKKREEEEKENAALRRQQEQEKHTNTYQVQRVPSPPIPTLRKNTHHHSPRPPTEECSLPGLQSPPVPTRRNQIRAAESIISELSVLRRRLKSEQKKLEAQLLLEWEPDSPPHDRHRTDVFDMARLRMQASVRRPFHRICEPIRSCELRPSKYRDAHIAGDVEIQAHRQQLQTSSPRDTDDLFCLSPPLPPTSQQPRQSGPEEDCLGGSLLESESAFIAHSGMLPVPPKERTGASLSARQRRRLKKQQNYMWPQSAESPPEQILSVRNTDHLRKQTGDESR